MLLILSLTHDCNLRCIYCYARGGEKKEYMSYSTARKAIEAYYHDGLKVQFTGGEPLLNYRLGSRISERYDLRFSLQTNATLLTAEKIEELSELGVKIGVSLDGAAEVNDFLRPYANGRGSTKDVLRAMMLLKGLGVRYGITCVVTTYNQNRLKEIVDIAQMFGAGSISFDILKKVGRGKNLPYPDESKVREAIEYSVSSGYRLRFRNVLQRELGLKCAAITGKSIFVTPTGEIMKTCATLAYIGLENVSLCPFRSQDL